MIEHKLDIGDSKPIKLPPRGVHRAYADTELQLIKGVKNQGIIQKSKSPWAFLLNQVMKKNVKVRPCIDYRKVNDVIKNDAFPLPKNFTAYFERAVVADVSNLFRRYYRVRVNV